MRYPQVLGETETLDRVLAGASLARYGDGELKLCRGGPIKSQAADDALGHRLRAILHDSGECLVGIPNIRSETPKVAFWGKHALGFAEFLSDRPYVSSFVSRPDSAPWIFTAEYWAKVEQLWDGRDVTIVRGSGKAFTPQMLESARSVREIMAPRQHAWSSYDSLLAEIGTPERVLLSVGPTATVLAVDLCARGVHAIDVGHMGAFYRRWVNGLRVSDPE